MKLSPEQRRTVVDTIRMLAADAVEQANSGHPGAPMGQADLAFVLWSEFLRFDPKDPAWPARDRFVLSCGHASMLLYGLLHLWGYDLPMDEIRRFRQLGSKTPGHPENFHTAGVEVTTGPLGQGVANSVGMALAAKMLRARVCPDQPEGFDPVPQRVFALCSDGDLMEGIASEAASMAGHWRLDNLVWVYDDNKITIDGDTELAFSEDVGQRFEGMGWHVLRCDGHDHESIRAALKRAVDEDARPTLIVARTHIGFGSPNKVDTAGVHGAPLGTSELAATRDQLGWPEERFHIPDAARAFFETSAAAKTRARQGWDAGFDAWKSANPEKASALEAMWRGEIDEDLWKALVEATPAAGATRKLSNAALNAAAARVPALVGGSADLSGSNGVNLKDTRIVGAPGVGERHNFGYEGRQMHFGIREHAMGAVANGMLLHGGLRPFTATFLVFSDYMRPSIRLAALSRLPNIFVFTHDSVFLGEDGPTHQPVEHHAALRLIPDLHYFRPADGVEVAMTWAWALKQTETPVAMGLTRQGVPEIARPEGFEATDVWRGGYVVQDVDGEPDVIFVGTGSELHLCLGAAEQLAADGVKARVVSMPCVELWKAQDAAWKQATATPGHPRIVTVEAGITDLWAAVSGATGLNIGIDTFGASAPASDLAEHFGLTVDRVSAKVRAWMG